MVIGQPVFDESVPKNAFMAVMPRISGSEINSLSFDIKDSMCGFRVYPLASTIKVLDSAKFQPRMGFDSEILVRLKWANVSFINVPTEVIYPEDGISHFNVWRRQCGYESGPCQIAGWDAHSFAKIVGTEIYRLILWLS